MTTNKITIRMKTLPATVQPSRWTVSPLETKSPRDTDSLSETESPHKTPIQPSHTDVAQAVQMETGRRRRRGGRRKRGGKGRGTRGGKGRKSHRGKGRESSNLIVDVLRDGVSPLPVARSVIVCNGVVYELPLHWSPER